jgi:hypothetical protein
MYKHTKSLVNGKHILLEYEAKSGVTQFSFNLSVLFGYHNNNNNNDNDNCGV